MEKDFFLIKDDDYDILYHAPSSRLAKVPKNINIDQCTDDELYNIFNNIKKVEFKGEKREIGKGNIQIFYMSSRTCNLGCKYCFADKGEYGCKENKEKFMNYNIYMKSLKFMNEVYKEGVNSIVFFGGEPLLNFNEIKKFIPDCIEFYKSHNMQVPNITISSNIVLLNYEISEFIKKYNINVAMSLDGPKKINDLSRVYKIGNGSVYEAVKKSILLMKKYDIKYHLQMVINKGHIKTYKKGKAIEWIKELESLESSSISIFPVVSNNPDIGITKDEFKTLDLITREITNYYIEKLYTRDCNVLCTEVIAPMMEIARNMLTKDCSAGYSVIVDTDGSIYPCQMLCNNNKYLIGNIKDEVIYEDRINKVGEISRFNSDICKGCKAKKICVVWCKGMQELYNNDPYEVISARCIFQRAMMEECIKALVKSKEDNEKYKIVTGNICKIFNRNRDEHIGKEATN